MTAATKDRQETQRKVALATLGCKVNQYESASFQSGLEVQGLLLVPFPQFADIYIINTCAVTAKAGAQSRRLVRQALNANPKARFVVTGCYAQIAAEEIRKLADTPICIVANNKKHMVVEAALAAAPSSFDPSLTRDASRNEEKICSLPVRRFADRTRAFLKIQDGCNAFCSYCIVPYARGRSRSQSPAEIIGQAEIFAREGYKEFVLTGIHAGAYGRDLDPRLNLLDLLKMLIRKTPAVRYRISSLEPTEITPELLRFFAETGNIMPHFHIPLQSGDNGILQKMNRRYTAGSFVDIVTEILNCIPNVAIGVDALVGFPGEDAAAFNNTVRTLTELPIAYLHVFPYSRRPGTPAAAMPGQVPGKIKEERVAQLRELDNIKRTGFYQRQVGKVHRVLAEGVDADSGLFKGFSENYMAVHFEAPEDIVNQVVNVKIKWLRGRRVLGVIQDRAR